MIVGHRAKSYMVVASIFCVVLFLFYYPSKVVRGTEIDTVQTETSSELLSVNDTALFSVLDSNGTIASNKVRYNILLLAVVKEGTNFSDYTSSIRSLECYAQMHGYQFILTMDSEHPECKQKDFMFRRHCIVAEYLTTTDYLVFLDADMAVVNPKRSFEEFIDPSFDFTFYERFNNFEIAAGSYIVKNTPYALDFLKRYADYEKQLPNSFHGTDNGAFHIFFAEELFPSLKEELRVCHTIYNSSRNFDDLFTYEACIRALIGIVQEFKGMRILKKGTSWVRDIWLTDSRWNPEMDFMLHALQEQRRIPYNSEIKDRALMASEHLLYYDPFLSLPNLSQCNGVDYEFDLDKRLIIPVPQIQSILKMIFDRIEKKRWIATGRVSEYIKEVDIEQLKLNS